MKFSIVNIDKKKALHLQVKVSEWFFERIKTDTKLELIGNLRHQLAMLRRRVHDTSSMVSEIDRLVYQLQDLTEEVPSFLRSVGAQALRGGLA